MDRFDLEQQILGCWNITDELKTLAENLDNLDKEQMANILIGMKGLYDIKFQKCFDTFEELIKNKKIT